MKYTILGTIMTVFLSLFLGFFTVSAQSIDENACILPTIGIVSDIKENDDSLEVFLTQSYNFNVNDYKSDLSDDYSLDFNKGVVDFYLNNNSSLYGESSVLSFETQVVLNKDNQPSLGDIVVVSPIGEDCSKSVKTIFNSTGNISDIFIEGVNPATPFLYQGQDLSESSSFDESCVLGVCSISASYADVEIQNSILMEENNLNEKTEITRIENRQQLRPNQVSDRFRGIVSGFFSFFK